MTKRELAQVYGYCLIAANNVRWNLSNLKDFYAVLDARLNKAGDENLSGCIRDAAVQSGCGENDLGYALFEEFSRMFANRTSETDETAIHSLDDFQAKLINLNHVFSFINQLGMKVGNKPFMGKREAIIYGYCTMAAAAAKWRIFTLDELFSSVETFLESIADTEISDNQIASAVGELIALSGCEDAQHCGSFYNEFSRLICNRTADTDDEAFSILKKFMEDMKMLFRQLADVC